MFMLRLVAWLSGGDGFVQQDTVFVTHEEQTQGGSTELDDCCCHAPLKELPFHNHRSMLHVYTEAFVIDLPILLSHIVFL